MKIVVFGQHMRLGVVQGHRILDLAQAARADGAADSGEPVFSSLLSLIEAGDRGLDLTRRLAEKFEGSDQPGAHADLAATRLHAPFPGRRFALAGSNYAGHIANAYTNRGRPTSEREAYSKARQAGKAGGFWAVTPPAGPGADIEVPGSAGGLFDYEGEAAVVLRKGGKRLAADRWQDLVWGTTLVIDWSVRSQALETRLPFYAHKNFDSSKSIGPWIAVGEVDPGNCEVETRVNGRTRQRFSSSDMIYSFGELLEQISQDLTLLPGDVLSGGTGPGTAVDSTVAGLDGPVPLDLFLKAGDTVEVASPGLGTLSARVVPTS